MNEHALPPAAQALADAPGMIPGPARDALRAAVSALDQAERQPSPQALCEALAQVGRSYRGVGAAAHAEWYLQQALRWARAVGSGDQVVEVLSELAEVAADLADEAAGSDDRHDHAARNRARDCSYEAARTAEASCDPQREVAVLVRVADVLERCGDRDDAIALQCRAIGVITRNAVADTVL